MDYEVYILEVDGKRRRITSAIALAPFRIMHHTGYRDLDCTFYEMEATKKIPVPKVGDPIEVRQVTARSPILISHYVFRGMISTIETTAQEGVLIAHRIGSTQIVPIVTGEQEVGIGFRPDGVVFYNNLVYPAGGSGGAGGPARSTAARPRHGIKVEEDTGRRRIAKEELPE